MSRRRLSSFKIMIGLSTLIGALITIFTPLYWIWNKIERPDFIDIDVIFKLFLSSFYLVFLYIAYVKIISRGLKYEEKPE